MLLFINVIFRNASVSHSTYMRGVIFDISLPSHHLCDPCLFQCFTLVGDDLVAMAANLDKLIAKPPPSKNLTFRISAGISKEDTPDEKALLGGIKNYEKTLELPHFS